MLANEGQDMDGDMIYIQKMELGLFTLQQVSLWFKHNYIKSRKGRLHYRRAVRRQHRVTQRANPHPFATPQK